MLFVGLLRLGWLIEFIPYIPISSFVTSASITILCTQVPSALGIPGINTREAPYKVIINIFRGLPRARLDAAIGVSSIVLLFAIRDFCAFMERRQAKQKRTWAFLSSLRMTFVMILFTVVSYLVNRNYDIDNPRFRIVGYIEPGFQKAGLPRPDMKLLGLIAPQLPAIVIILVIEHIAIAKAMGRLYDYTITPSQEIVALGAANLFSPFVGGYVCTGSFGASAVLSKSGVRTPLAGLFSACVLVLALYALTGVFKYIPNAALAGLIIHAVCNLLAPPRSLYKYWQLSPLELVIWVVGVVVAVFESLETSIYVGIALSFVLLLVRLARTRGQFLGVVDAHRVVGENEDEEQDCESEDGVKKTPSKRASSLHRDIYMPLSRRDASNPNIKVDTPYPGVFVYRFNEGYNYTNQGLHVEALTTYITTHTRRTSDEQFERESDRLWNDPGPKASIKLGDDDDDDDRPLLRAVVLDLSAVNNMDVTSIQGLIDLRNTLERYCSPDAVELHFASVHNRWTRRALAASGFGFPSALNAEAQKCWQPAFTIAAILDQGLGEAKSTPSDLEQATCSRDSDDDATVADTSRESDATPCERTAMASVYGVDRPFFHHDLHDAVESAVRDARLRDGNCRLMA
jgi:solute carrier family 26 (sodium-independent sulfate anion transporter), member 11